MLKRCYHIMVFNTIFLPLGFHPSTQKRRQTALALSMTANSDEDTVTPDPRFHAEDTPQRSAKKSTDSSVMNRHRTGNANATRVQRQHNLGNVMLHRQLSLKFSRRDQTRACSIGTVEIEDQACRRRSVTLMPVIQPSVMNLTSA